MWLGGESLSAVYHGIAGEVRLAKPGRDTIYRDEIMADQFICLAARYSEGGGNKFIQANGGRWSVSHNMNTFFIRLCQMVRVVGAAAQSALAGRRQLAELVVLVPAWPQTP